MNNRSLAQIARVAGAPSSKQAGLILKSKLGDKVNEKDTLFSIYAENNRKLRQAEEIAKTLEPIRVGRRIGEEMLFMKISESTKLGAERYILDR